jgi:hypothetical protein
MCLLHTLVGVEVITLQKMFKFVFLHLKTGWHNAPCSQMLKPEGHCCKVLFLLVNYCIMSWFKGVTRDRVWIGEWIYWPLMRTNQNYKHLTMLSLIHALYKSLHARFSQSASTSYFQVTNLNNKEILQLLWSCHCPLVNIPQLNCAVSSQPPLQNSTVT